MSLHIYPLTKTAESVQHYTVRINGIPVTPDTARVSAVPYNRRWPGHQRSIDQTFGTSGKFHAEHSIKIHLCCVSLPIGCII